MKMVKVMKYNKKEKLTKKINKSKRPTIYKKRVENARRDNYVTLLKPFEKIKVKREIKAEILKKRGRKAKKYVDLEPKLVQKGTIEALVKAVIDMETKSTGKELLDDSYKYLLQITMFKIPQQEDKIKMQNVYLTNSLVNDETDICLIVKDLQRGRKINTEPTKNYYQDLLDEHNIKCINKIIPISELINEYSSYEAKIKLVNSFDIFLVEGSISDRVGQSFGAVGVKYKKSPIKVRELSDSTIKKNIEDAIHRVGYFVKPTAACISIPVGTNTMHSDEISDNIFDLIEKLKLKIPGGWQNIKALHLGTNDFKKIMVQLYLSLGNPNNVPVPVVTSILKEKIAKTKKMLESSDTTYVVTKTARVYTPSEKELLIKKEERLLQEEMDKMNILSQEKFEKSKKLKTSKDIKKIPEETIKPKQAKKLKGKQSIRSTNYKKKMQTNFKSKNGGGIRKSERKGEYKVEWAKQKKTGK